MGVQEGPSSTISVSERLNGFPKGWKSQQQDRIGVVNMTTAGFGTENHGATKGTTRWVEKSSTERQEQDLGFAAAKPGVSAKE